MAKTLYLIHSTSTPETLAQALLARTDTLPWMFLCQDYTRQLRWEKALGERFARLPVREALAAAAAELRQPFLDLITALGRKHDSLAWWASRISERNTAVCPLFLYCCFLKLGKAQFARGEGSLAIAGESWALLAGLANEAERQGYAVRWLSRQNAAWSRLFGLGGRLVRIVRFLARGFVEGRLGPVPRQLPPGRPHVLLRTWIDEQCLGEDGNLQDRYLPGLAAWLEAQCLAVAHVPVLFNLPRGRAATWRWLASSQQRFINAYRCYRVSDYVTALKEAQLSLRLEFGTIRLGDLSAGALFAETQARYAYDSGTLEALLSHRLPLRLAERGFRFDLFIDEYENMIPEKPLILGFRKYSPRTRLVGFQHGALYPMLLCNFVTHGEAAFAPLPDRIVCNGPMFRDILIREGLPAERTVAGPALRYRHLWNAPPQPGLPARQGIFVPLPLMQSDAVELLTKLMMAFGADAQTALYLKPHPMSSLTHMLRAAGIHSLPPHFSAVSGDIGVWLARAQVVIALSSSALYEALAAGVPVVPVGREAALDLNPLAWHAGFAQQFSTSGEIRGEAMRLIRLAPDELQAYRAHARQLLAQSFGPVCDATLHSFIDGILPALIRSPN